MSAQSQRNSVIFRVCERTIGPIAVIQGAAHSVVRYGHVHVRYDTVQHGFEIFGQRLHQYTTERAAISDIIANNIGSSANFMTIKYIPECPSVDDHFDTSYGIFEELEKFSYLDLRNIGRVVWYDMQPQR